MTIVDTDLDLTILEDLDEEVPCEIKMPCDAPAEWYMIRSCCDATIALCNHHKILAELIISMEATHKCTECGTTIDAEDIRLEKR